METMQPDGSITAIRGHPDRLCAGLWTGDPGRHVWLRSGYTPSGRFDALLAKLIACHGSGDFLRAVSRLQRALAEFHVAGAAVNIPFLQRLLRHPAFRNASFHTRFVDDHLSELVVADEPAPEVSMAPAASEPASEPSDTGASELSDTAAGEPPAPPAESPEPGRAAPPPRQIDTPPGAAPVPSPLQGTIVSVEVREGATIRTGQLLVVVESMKMEHEIHADADGVVRRVAVNEGDVINAGEPLAFVEAAT